MPMARSLSFPCSSLQVLLCTVVGMYLVIIFLSSLPLSDSSLLAGVRRAGQGLELGLFPKSEDAKWRTELLLLVTPNTKSCGGVHLKWGWPTPFMVLGAEGRWENPTPTKMGKILKNPSWRESLQAAACRKERLEAQYPQSYKGSWSTAGCGHLRPMCLSLSSKMLTVGQGPEAYLSLEESQIPEQWQASLKSPHWDFRFYTSLR